MSLIYFSQRDAVSRTANVERTGRHKWVKNLHANTVSTFLPYCAMYKEKYFFNLVKSTRNQNVFTIFRLIWSQTDVRLDPNQLENGKYNLIIRF